MGKAKTRPARRRTQVEINIFINLSVWYKYLVESKHKSIAAYGVLTESAPHAPAPPADCIDLSKFVFVEVHTKFTS